MFSVEAGAVASMLDAATRSHHREDWSLTAFSGFPTAMLFGPNARHEGSMHYMFFPACARQRFHHHPGSRYLLVLGDVELSVHYSNAPCNADPESDAETLVIPTGTLTALRLPPRLWHCFETRGGGSGLLALSFHDDDEVPDPLLFGDDLMEARTVYWSGVA